MTIAMLQNQINDTLRRLGDVSFQCCGLANESSPEARFDAEAVIGALDEALAAAGKSKWHGGILGAQRHTVPAKLNGSGKALCRALTHFLDAVQQLEEDAAGLARGPETDGFADAVERLKSHCKAHKKNILALVKEANPKRRRRLWTRIIGSSWTSAILVALALLCHLLPGISLAAPAALLAVTLCCKLINWLISTWAIRTGRKRKGWDEFVGAVVALATATQEFGDDVMWEAAAVLMQTNYQMKRFIDQSKEIFEGQHESITRLAAMNVSLITHLTNVWKEQGEFKKEQREFNKQMAVALKCEVDVLPALSNDSSRSALTSDLSHVSNLAGAPASGFCQSCYAPPTLNLHVGPSRADRLEGPNPRLDKQYETLEQQLTRLQAEFEQKSDALRAELEQMKQRNQQEVAVDYSIHVPSADVNEPARDRSRKIAWSNAPAASSLAVRRHSWALGPRPPGAF